MNFKSSSTYLIVLFISISDKSVTNAFVGCIKVKNQATFNLHIVDISSYYINKNEQITRIMMWAIKGNKQTTSQPSQDFP
jgi:hypothetical protein